MFNCPCVCACVRMCVCALTFQVCVRGCVCAPVPYRLLNGLHSTDDYIKTFLLLLRMTNTQLKGYTKLLPSVPYWWTFQVFLIFYICQFLFLPFLLHRFLDVGLLCRETNVPGCTIWLLPTDLRCQTFGFLPIYGCEMDFFLVSFSQAGSGDLLNLTLNRD